ncbi:cytosine permease [Streptomyces sp. NPDC096311]|uniref:cytosine permease n=1 Tax=Streptomyces sp. NPDC096311 TaxID=3366083 RepID=UPI003804F289
MFPTPALWAWPSCSSRSRTSTSRTRPPACPTHSTSQPVDAQRRGTRPQPPGSYYTCLRTRTRVTSGSQAVYGAPIWDPIALSAKMSNTVGALFALLIVMVATLSVNIAANVVSPPVASRGRDLIGGKPPPRWGAPCGRSSWR